MEISGRFFDGHSSEPRAARLRVKGAYWTIVRDGTEDITFSRQQVRLREPLGNTARIVEFPSLMRFESSDFAQMDQMPVGWVHRLEGRWSIVFLAIVSLAAFAVCCYLFLLPFVAEKVAFRLPHSLLVQMSEGALRGFTLSDSGKPLVPPENLKKASEHLHRALPEGTASSAVLFRKAEALGANAFALPDGTMVVTGKLAKILNEDQIFAVLLHEAGHVHYRHSAQALVRGAILSGGLFLLAGHADWSSLVGVLLSQANSREFETQADTFAALTLKKQGLKAGLLADALLAIEKSEHVTGMETVPGFLMSHPLTEDRVRALRRWDKP